MKNEILEEVWRVRDEISAECGHDLKRLAAMLRKDEAKYGDRLVSYAPLKSKVVIHKPAAKAEKPTRAKRKALPA